MTYTVKDALEILNPVSCVRVSVRRRVRYGIEYLGGGSASDCIRRFGNLNVINSDIYENCLCIYVI